MVSRWRFFISTDIPTSAIGSTTNHRGLIEVTATVARPSCMTQTVSAEREVGDESVQDNNLLHHCDNSSHSILSVLAIGSNRRYRERGMHRSGTLATINIDRG